MENEYIDLSLDSDGILDDPFELFMQEIELAFTIYVSEIWNITGDMNLKRYIFSRYVSVSDIRNEIKSFIDSNSQFSMNFQYNIGVEIIPSDRGDMIYITFDVKSDEKTYQTVKKFLIGK